MRAVFVVQHVPRRRDQCGEHTGAGTEHVRAGGVQQQLAAADLAIGELGEQPRLARAGLAVDPDDRLWTQQRRQFDVATDHRIAAHGDPGPDEVIVGRTDETALEVEEVGTGEQAELGECSAGPHRRRAGLRARRPAVASAVTSWRHRTSRCGWSAAARRRRAMSRRGPAAGDRCVGPLFLGGGDQFDGVGRGRHRPQLVGDVVERPAADAGECRIDQLGGRPGIERSCRGDRGGDGIDVDGQTPFSR